MIHIPPTPPSKNIVREFAWVKIWKVEEHENVNSRTGLLYKVFRRTLLLRWKFICQYENKEAAIDFVNTVYRESQNKKSKIVYEI